MNFSKAGESGWTATAFVLANVPSTIQSIQGKKNINFLAILPPGFPSTHTTTEVLCNGQNSDSLQENEGNGSICFLQELILASSRFKCQAAFKDVLGHVHICIFMHLKKRELHILCCLSSPNILTRGYWVFMYLYCIKYPSTFLNQDYSSNIKFSKSLHLKDLFNK